ncbi:restriction endonuclease [Candidatus Bathyarchaeota archaeon]|nr:restriction endonuclease [Candidatus Bathyarchaeota archaeon]
MTNQSLLELAIKYFKLRGYQVEQDVMLNGASGVLQTFDLLISRPESRHIVMVKDWKRTVGVNMVINIDRASADVRIPNPIIVAEMFSDHAKAYANRRGVTLLTKREILAQISEPS